MFNYDREKGKLDKDLEFGRLSEKKYQYAIECLDETAEKIRQLKEQLDAGQIDGKKYNLKELEIIHTYDAALSQSAHSNEHAKKVAKNIFYIVSAVACFAIAIGVTIIARENYKHRSVAGIPEPIQQKGEGDKEFQTGYTYVKIKYIASYTIDGIIISKEKAEPDNAYYEAVPYAVGLAWGYAAEHNHEISWNYANRNIKAVDIGNLDRIKITKDSSINELIPANEDISKQIDKYYLGDRIKIKGYLVDVAAENGLGKYSAASSLIRGDTTNFIVGGASANEIIYVTDISPVY